jgi:hypothetical protein
MALIPSAIQFGPSFMSPSDGSEVAMVARHLREDESHIARQLETVSRLRARGHSTTGAEELLAAFERAQRIHYAHLRRLAAERECKRWSGSGRAE